MNRLGWTEVAALRVIMRFRVVCVLLLALLLVLRCCECTSALLWSVALVFRCFGFRGGS